MYSVVLMMAITTAGESPARHGCSGCQGSACYGVVVYYGCSGGCHGERRARRARHGCHGCRGGCQGAACYGSACWGCYGAGPMPAPRGPATKPEPIKKPKETQPKPEEEQESGAAQAAEASPAPQRPLPAVVTLPPNSLQPVSEVVVVSRPRLFGRLRR